MRRRRTRGRGQAAVPPVLLRCLRCLASTVATRRTKAEKGARLGRRLDREQVGATRHDAPPSGSTGTGPFGRINT